MQALGSAVTRNASPSRDALDPIVTHFSFSSRKTIISLFSTQSINSTFPIFSLLSIQSSDSLGTFGTLTSFSPLLPHWPRSSSFSGSTLFSQVAGTALKTQGALFPRGARLAQGAIFSNALAEQTAARLLSNIDQVLGQPAPKVPHASGELCPVLKSLPKLHGEKIGQVTRVDSSVQSHG